jgi:hypothetical protein
LTKPTSRPSRARLTVQKVVMFDEDTAAIIAKRAIRAKKSDGAIIRELVELGIQAERRPAPNFSVPRSAQAPARVPQPLL